MRNNDQDLMLLWCKNYINKSKCFLHYSSCLNYSETVDALSNGLIALCLNKMDIEKQEIILSGMVNF